MLITILACLMLILSGTPAKKEGTLLLMGGGKTAPEAVKQFVEAAGGPDAPLVVLAQTQENPVQSGPRSAEQFREAGAKFVTAPAGVSNEEMKTLLAKAKGVWIPGGDQSRFVETFPEASGVPAAIRDVWKRGGVVGGTSAGASLAGSLMPTGAKTDVEGVQTGACPVRAGLNLLPNAIIDQHFFRRNRFQRLLTAILDNPGTFGIGLDEGAWITIHKAKMQAYGGQVSVLLPRKKAGKTAGSLGGEIVLYVLLPGQTMPLFGKKSP